MTKHSDGQIRAAEFFRAIVEQAIDAGAESIDFERVREGLEITALAGGKGTGDVLKDRKLEAALFEWVDTNSKISRGDRCTVDLVIHDRKYTVAIEWYDLLGEKCFQVLLDPNGQVSEHVIDFDDDFADAEYFAECAGCEADGPLDSMGLCPECGDKLERDLIRQNDWDYTVVGFGLPVSQRAAYRAKVIEQYGVAMELIVDERAKQSARGKQAKPDRKRKRRRNRHK